MISKNKKGKLKYKVSPKGSLGILAFGDIGIREWRKVKQNVLKSDVNDEE